MNDSVSVAKRLLFGTRVVSRNIVTEGTSKIDKGSQMITIYVDTNANEDDLASEFVQVIEQKNILKNMDVEFQVKRKRLDVGDIEVVYADGRLVFERKTWEDLRASIIDTRASDQKMRLKRYVEECVEANPGEKSHIFYIIEGELQEWTMSSVHSKLPSSRLYQYLFLTQVRDNMHVLHLKNKNDICKSILYMAIKGLRGELGQTDRVDVGGRVARYSKKRKNTSSDGTWYNMLCSIEGVGEKKARAITETYPTAKKLITDYIKNDDNEEARIKLVSNIVSGKKSIGKAVSTRVHAAMYGE